MNKLLLLTILFIAGCCQQHSCDIDAFFSDVTPIVQEAESAFSKAEEKVLNIQPDNIIRPDPDPAKCPCKGSGLIKQGDGHVTQCPFHGKTTQVLKR